MKHRVLVISNLEPGDETFESDVGCWNISRAQRGCDAGKHELISIDVAELMEASRAIEVDADKVAEFVAADLERFPPLILAMEDGKAFLIEGHHRLRALHQRGIAECSAWLIEENDGRRYRIWFNGSRVAPWRQSKQQRNQQRSSEQRGGDGDDA